MNPLRACIAVFDAITLRHDFEEVPSMRDWLEEDHLVYRLLDVVELLDIRSLSYSIEAKDARGTPPQHPRMMLGLLLYSYINGIYSSRQIATATYKRIDFRALTGNRGALCG